MRKIEKLETGSHRENKTGKGRFDLIPPLALKAVALRLEEGVKKYGEKDWKKGIPSNMLIDSALRHIFQYHAGENDEDHISSAITNLMFLKELELIERYDKCKF